MGDLGSEHSTLKRNLGFGFGLLSLAVLSGITLAQDRGEAEPSPSIETPVASPPPAAPVQVPILRTKYEFEKIENGVVHILAPTGAVRPPPIKTHLFDLEFLGMIHPKGKTPAYLLLKGLTCPGCTKQSLLYLARVDGKDPHVLTVPGTIRDRKNGGILLQSQAYWGKCLPEMGEGFFAFQSEKVDRRRFRQDSVLTLTLEDDGRISEKLNTARRAPKLKTAQQAQKKGTCFQVKGFDRDSLRFDVPRLKGAEEREKEEMEKEKELESIPEKELEKKEEDPAAQVVN